MLFHIGSQFDRNIFIFLCIPGYKFRAAQRIQLRCSDSVTYSSEFITAVSYKVTWAFKVYKNIWIWKLNTYNEEGRRSPCFLSLNNYRFQSTFERDIILLSYILLSRDTNTIWIIYLEARVSPGKVTTGVPAHSTSIAVVWPLHSGVSRQRSANWPRRTCSSLHAIFENTTRPAGNPDILTKCTFSSGLYIIHMTVQNQRQLNSSW